MKKKGFFENAVFFCGSPWGMGVYKSSIDGDMVYGYPPKGSNPHDFTPDPEACTEKEIAAWEEAKKWFDLKKE